jgi:2-keto-3-deoxy-L-fuconate dehydrogenase
MDLVGKRALITGAGQGIGYSTAELFTKAGAKVFGCDINIEPLSALRDVVPIKLNVTDVDAIASLSRQIDIDILFNCAGVVHEGSILECTNEEWSASLGLNVTSMFNTIRFFLPGMLARKSGSIINMSSVASSIKGVNNRCAYGASKAAVIGLTRAVAADYVSQGIRCNAICPGTVESPSLQKRISARASSQRKSEQQIYQDFVSRQPVGRIGKPEEIAQLALYLASDVSQYTTGTEQVIDGGWSN